MKLSIFDDAGLELATVILTDQALPSDNEQRTERETIGRAITVSRELIAPDNKRPGRFTIEEILDAYLNEDCPTPRDPAIEWITHHLDRG